MENYDVNKILDEYNEEDKKEIIITMRFMALIQAAGAPQTEEEFKAFCEKVINDKREKEEKEKAKAEKKANREKAKAEEMNMTVEEYKEYKRLLNNRRRNNNELEKLQKEVARLTRKVAEYDKKIAQYEK